ncbi:MAG TPA: PilZ domain-containing protein [Terriglobales bacterium]|nr:PilZ domain-containing protein [Terriglobales bacterium]
MTTDVALRKRECLVIADGGARSAVMSSARALSLKTESSTHHEVVERLLSGDRFAIVVLDGELPEASLLLPLVRQYCARNAAVSLLLLPEKAGLPRGFGRGATLVIRKPLATDTARTALRSALHLTRPARRRTQRLSLEPLVHIACGGRAQRGQVVDISESGIGATISEPLPRGTTVELRLLLPGMKDPILVSGIVARSTPELMGIRFAEFAAEEHQAVLQDWLAYFREFSQRSPAAVGPAPRAENARRGSAAQRSTWGRMWNSVVRA